MAVLFQHFSMYGKIHESASAEIVPLIRPSALRGQYPEFAQGSLSGTAAV